MPHKVQVQAATVVGLGESRVIEEVLFSDEQGIHSVKQGCATIMWVYCLNTDIQTYECLRPQPHCETVYQEHT